MTERVTIEKDGGVAHVCMRRSDKLNALDSEMFEGLIAAGKNLREDRSVRAVVLSGEGRAFCAGLDFASFMAMGEGTALNLLERTDGSPANNAQRAAYVWQEVPVPVIAAVQGYAFGGGLQIALAADIRYVAPDAQLSVMEIKWGLIPDMSGTQTLRRLLRLDVAKELTFTGRRVGADEAVAIGLATRKSEDPLADAMATAREIAGKSPDAIRAGKKLLNESGLVDLAEGLRLEEKAQVGLVGTPNQVESVQANMQKREPKFSDPS